jgi:hypothetical protein
MSGVARFFGGIYDRLSQSQRQAWAPIRILPGHGSDPDAAPVPIVKDDDYIAVRVNQLFLATDRQWFTTVEPGVFASVEFLYGRDLRTDTVVLGPKAGTGLPSGTVLMNQPIFGVHPYKGGAVTLTVLLSQVPTGNVARPLLDVMESIGQLTAPGAGVAAHAKVVGTLLDGFERLLGLDDVKPILGFRQTIDPDRGDQLLPGHIVLLEGQPIPPEELWVIDHMLHRGTTRDRAKANPLTGHDFVLLELTRAKDGRRTDVARFPFYEKLQQAMDSALKSAQSDAAWMDTKALHLVAASDMIRSPDLTYPQALALNEAYFLRLKELREKALSQALASGEAADGADDGPDADRLRLASRLLALD